MAGSGLSGILRGLLPLQFASGHLRRHVVLLRHLLRALRQRVERRQPRRHGGVVNSLRLELLVDVGGQAACADAIDVARRGAKTQPVENVHDGAVVGLLRDR